jgi:hypothetical protein
MLMTDEPFIDHRPELGATYRLADADYRFGAGRLLVTVTVTSVVGLMDVGATEKPDLWWEVHATAVPPGAAGPTCSRVLYLRAAALAVRRSMACE